MPLIKSHSNYVLKKKHQLIDDGTVFERDITTIGAVNQFAPGQTPIYRSGNFIITVRDDRGGMNQYNTQKWENSISGETWTLNSISGMVSSDENQNDTRIVLKNDYYDFREFAYYGSLTELFRSSMNDILERFPGELYCVPDTPAYYTSGYTEDFERIEDRVRLGDGYLVSNPYGINIHSAKKPIEETNPLKYFAESGYTNYEVIVGDATTGTKVTEWKVTPVNTCATIGDKISTVSINGTNIDVYLGDNKEVVYVCNTGGMHIRPKKEFITEFYNGCSNFERLILNENTSPKYKATFSVIKENDFGYYRELQDFVFPTSEGDYNPDTSGNYIDRLVQIGEFYDENLTDNLYRVMTHEAIKNFDWTYTREYNEGDEEVYRDGGQKIQKALRIFAREFDEVKTYIDNIKNTGRITYDERGNVPDYFLADICEDDGWDIKSVIPYDLEGDEGDWSGTAEILDNVRPHKYSQSSVSAVTPYSPSYITDGTKDGYFVTCENGGGVSSCHLNTWYGDTISASSKPYTFAFPSDRLVNRIKSYSDSANTYTYMDVNNEFLKRLKLNSRAIWRHKGTLEGIEMILGMFGFKSKRWLERVGNYRYSGKTSDPCSNRSCNNIYPDYEIIEYTQFTSPIKDKWDDLHQMYHIDWINSTKTIVYDNRNTSNYTLPGSMGADYSAYQGLPISYRLSEKETKEKPYPDRLLYPNFNKYEQLDGNPYFQMDGGWLAKTLGSSGTTYQNFQFDVDDNIVHTPSISGGVVDGFIVDDNKLYKETIRSIKRVENLGELLSLPQSDLYDGIICYVGRINDVFIVIDGEVFPIEYDRDGKMYVRFTRSGGFIKVGGLYFDENIVVLDENFEPVTYSLDDKLDGYEIKAYIEKTDGAYTFVCKSASSDYYSVTSYQLVSGKDKEDDNEYSNYFKLDDIVFSDEITYSRTGNGWRRLLTTDNEYRKINTIANYYEGNNGHNGNLSYDSGHKYFTYFQRIFKHAEDNGLFDTRCYKNGFDDVYIALHPEDKPLGFSGLIHDNEDVTDYDTYLSADTKVHYFGNYKTRKEEDNSIDKIWIYGDDVDRVNNFNIIYSGETNNIDHYNLSASTDDGWIEDFNPYSGNTSKVSVIDEVTNQIVNNKRIKIVFNMKNEFNSKEGQIELKYVDDIVMNYLTQLIPSTAIVEIEYDFCGFNNRDC